MAEPLLILHVFSTFATGGPQTRFAAIANGLGQRFRHAVVAMNGDLTCRTLLNPDVTVQFPAITVRKGDTLGNVRRFRAVLREMQPHALFTSNWGSIEWAMANAWPVVRHVHVEDGFGPEEAAGQLPRRVLMRRVLLRRRQVVVPSRTLLRIATEQWRLPRVQYLPNGVDLQRFAPRPPADGPPVIGLGGPPVIGPGGPPVIGTVATLRTEKNLKRLLRSFAIASGGGPARLVIAGDGPERPGLEQLAGALGIADRVAFLGQISDPARCYDGFDILAMSSDTEQMPLAVLEAMGAGLPVVATDVGDIKAMVAEANHPFITARDDDALAAALRTLLADPAQRRAVGTANRARAEAQYDQRRMFEGWAALMEGPAS